MVHHSVGRFAMAPGKEFSMPFDATVGVAAPVRPELEHDRYRAFGADLDALKARTSRRWEPEKRT